MKLATFDIKIHLIQLIKYFKLFIKFFLAIFSTHSLIVVIFLFSYLCELYKLTLPNKPLNNKVLMDLLYLLKKDPINIDLSATTLPNFSTYSNIIAIFLLIVLQMVLVFLLFLARYCVL